MRPSSTSGNSRGSQAPHANTNAPALTYMPPASSVPRREPPARRAGDRLIQGAPRREPPRLRLVDRPRDVREVDLRPAPLELGALEPGVRDADPLERRQRRQGQRVVRPRPPETTR